MLIILEVIFSYGRQRSLTSTLRAWAGVVGFFGEAVKGLCDVEAWYFLWTTSLDFDLVSCWDVLKR